MSPLAIDGVLFDVDETLYDRDAAQRLILQRLAAERADLFGSRPVADVAAAWQRSDRETAEHVYTRADVRASRNVRSAVFLRLLGLPEGHAGEVTDLYVRIYGTVSAPVAGAVPVVAACAARYPVGVVSNAFPDVQYRKLEALGLASAFRCIVLSEEFGARKPDPSIFLRGCQLLGVAPGRCLYVGDSFANDVAGARAAGLVPCWYSPRGAAPPPGQAAPDLQLSALTDLLAVLGA